MTAGDPGGRGHEVLSYGSDEPPRRPPALPLAVAAACLALGFAVGAGFGDRHPARTVEPVREPVAASAVSKLSNSVEDPRFWLRVFNLEDESIEVTVSALPGWGRLEQAAPTRIAPRTWGAVPFEADPDCSLEPGNVRVARLRVRTSNGAAEHTVGLAESGRALREYYSALCAPRSPPGGDQLAGVWLVEKGPGGLPVGELLMRFGQDGRFAVDASGLLLTHRAGMRGRYRLSAGHLTLVVDGGRSCASGDRLSWDVGLLADGRLRVDHVSDNDGSCETTPQVWIARRLLATSTLER